MREGHGGRTRSYCRAGKASVNTVFLKSGLISAAAHRLACIYKVCQEYITSLLSEMMSAPTLYGFQRESWVLSINNSQVLSI